MEEAAEPEQHYEDAGGHIPVTTRLPLEARDAKEDWSGLKDAAKRRKLQNRLHQRAWRMHSAYSTAELGMLT